MSNTAELDAENLEAYDRVLNRNRPRYHDYAALKL